LQEYQKFTFFYVSLTNFSPQQLHPDFDVKRVVLKAIDGRKLLVTIPWLVEYLAMLDFITIRLDYYRDLFQLLYTIYMRVNVVNQSKTLCVMPTSKFIIRACLGWLFEHPEIPEEYYNYNKSKLAIKGDEDEEILVENSQQLNPHLENVLNAACPFLADFRVSMMPQRMTKVVSRTGRYRHITTKFQDKTEQQTKVQDSRERLIEAFLASQTLSVRKVVDFTIDRVTSAVVKDFQVKHMLPRRKDAKAEVEAILTSDVDSMMKKMIDIFHKNLLKLQNQWNDEVKENCKKRVEGAFDSLLPIETLNDVKKTLINITFDKASEKLQEWRTSNIATIEIFSKDIQAEAIKLIENNQQNGNKRTTASIVIELSTVMPSDFFKDLQTLLHKASLYPEKIETGEIVTCISKAVEVVDKQILPSNAYRNIAFYTLQLILLVIASRGELITQDFLQAVYALWRHERLSPYTSQPQQQQHESRQTRIKVDNFVFSKVISARLMITMQGKPRQTLQTYGDFLVDLVRENFIGCEQINEQSVQLYKHEWSGECLNDIAFLMNHVKSSVSSRTSSSPESHLFMELVADLAREMEDF
jgi:codanin-1